MDSSDVGVGAFLSQHSASDLILRQKLYPSSTPDTRGEELQHWFLGSQDGFGGMSPSDRRWSRGWVRINSSFFLHCCYSVLGDQGQSDLFLLLATHSIFVELHLMSFQPLPIPHHTGLFSDLPPSSSDMVPPLSGRPV